MKNNSHRYRIITKASGQALFKDRRSKFYGYAFPIKEESDVKAILENLRKNHHNANHVCYAWQLGIDNPRYRVYDDGEPNNSAGHPIYGQIQAFGVTNVLVTVVRIFGGTKLGVGGLINAYRSAAQISLEESEIIEKTKCRAFTLTFNYLDMDRVMRIIKQHKISILSQDFDSECTMCIAITIPEVKTILTLLSGIQYIAIIEK